MNAKDKILEKMREFDEKTLDVAYAYALYLTKYGVDVTKEWKTAVVNCTNLEKAYRDGYYKGLYIHLASEPKENNEV